MKERLSLIALATGLLTFALYDLDISRAVVSQGNPFGLFFQEWGEFPGYVLILYSLYVQLRYSDRLWIKVLIVALLPLVGAALYFRYREFTDLYVGLILALVILLPIYLAKIPADKLKLASDKTIAVALLVPLAFVQTIKLLWGRVRFRDLGGDFSRFTPWYLPQGYTGNFSFPSGHAAMGVFLLTMNYYFQRKEVLWATLVWAIMVAVSRVIIGAHYASDVWVSFFTGLLVYFHFDARSSSTNSAK